MVRSLRGASALGLYADNQTFYSVLVACAGIFAIATIAVVLWRRLKAAEVELVMLRASMAKAPPPLPSTSDLRGKVALVTGAGTGIGKEIARALHQAGAAVAITGRRAEVLQSTAEWLRAAPTRDGGADPGVLVLAGDVGEVADVASFFAKTEERFGGLDILVNNAGTIQGMGPAADCSVEDFDATIKTNLRGTFLCSKAAIPLMRKRGGGTILNNSSCIGEQAWKGLAAYAASKGGINMLTKGMAVDHSAEGIRVNAFSPGTTDTEITDIDAPALKESGLASLYPIGRIGCVSDMASIAVLLCSPGTEFINGAIIPVDGGLTAACKK